MDSWRARCAATRTAGSEARAGETGHRESMAPRSGPTLLRQRGQPRVPAPAWDPAADRPAWRGVVGAAWAASLEGRAVAVVVELLAAAWDAVGPGLGAVLCVRAGGLCGRLLQPPRTEGRRRSTDPPVTTLSRSPEVAWPARMAISTSGLEPSGWCGGVLVPGMAQRGDTAMPTGVGRSSARLRALVSGPAFQVGRARHSARGPLT
jgi:hypothetical protein